MNNEDLMWLDATAQADMVRRREVQARELLEAAAERIAALNPKLNAVVTSLVDAARAAVPKAPPSGPFGGVPFLLKDLDACSAGDPFYCGTKFLKAADFRAPRDSFLVEKFRQAGFAILGKTNTPEFGLAVTTEPESFGAARNPWNRGHSTGGSSGGAAAAVASGMVGVAHASDGGGSIRIPASECGLVGLKPSRGRISLGPDYGEYWSGMVTSHVVSRSVRDSAAILDAIAGAMPGDPYVAPRDGQPYGDAIHREPGRLRVGLLTHVPDGSAQVHPECVAAVEHAGKTLESLGHHVELSFPGAFLDQEAGARFSTIVTAWVAAALAEWGGKLGREIQAAEVEPATWLFAEMGRAVSAARYIETLHGLNRYTRAMAQWWADGFDVLVTPTLGAPPPRLGELVPPADNPMLGLLKTMAFIPFTPPFNMTGQPAISLPLWWSTDGLPIGVQFVGAYGREDVLLSLAAQLEQAVPWAHRRPPA